MSVSNIGFGIKINQVPIQIDFDTRVNIRKDFIYARNATSFFPKEVGVSYLDRSDINPIDNIFIADKTDLVFENSPIQVLEQVKYTKIFQMPKGKFLISDVFITTPEGIDQAQYYWHDLSTLPFDIINIEVLNSNFEPVPAQNYVYYNETSLLGYNCRHIYTNLQSTYSQTNNTYQVYFVRYTRQDTLETSVELLNPKPIYVENLFTSGANYRTYSIQENYGQNEITINFNSKVYSPTPYTISRVSIKVSEEERIYVEKPVFSSSKKRWKLRVNKGEFFKTTSGSISDLDIGIGDGGSDTFDLSAPLVYVASMVVSVGGTPSHYPTDFDILRRTGPNNTDQIKFTTAPNTGQHIVVSFEYDPQVAKYYIPEYDNQIFSPTEPYKQIKEQICYIVNERLIYVQPAPIATLNLPGFYLYIVQKDINGKPVLAITNDPNADTYVDLMGNISNQPYNKSGIQSVSEQDGFIYLNTNISTNLPTYITYKYSEDYFVYNNLEINPTLNEGIRDNKAVVYIKPELSRMTVTGKSTNTIARSVYHLIVDIYDNIILSNENIRFVYSEGVASGGSLNTLIDTSLALNGLYAGFELEILDGPNLGRRLKITNFDSITKTLTVSATYIGAITSGTRYRINRKYNSYSVTDPVTSTLIAFIGWKDFYQQYPYFGIILSEVRLVNLVSAVQFPIYDVRQLGGGIREDSSLSALTAQNRVNDYWDYGYWDGRSYPGMGALLIEMPRTILRERGGAFTADQVKDIAMRHMADGYYPIIKYYDRNTEILKLIPSNQKITIFWKDVGADSYNIHYGDDPTLLEDMVSVSGNILFKEISSLESNRTYYFSVEAVVDGLASYPSRIASAIPYDLSIRSSLYYGNAVYESGSYSS